MAAGRRREREDRRRTDTVRGPRGPQGPQGREVTASVCTIQKEKRESQEMHYYMITENKQSNGKHPNTILINIKHTIKQKISWWTDGSVTQKSNGT